MSKIRWGRSDEGFVSSHCGRWKISPVYWGSTRAQSYQLHRDGKRVASFCQTQAEAKQRAEELLGGG